MIAVTLGNEKALWLLFLVPVVLVPVYIWCFWRKAGMLRVLAGIEMLKKINFQVSFRKQLLKAILLIFAFVSIVIALTEPRWNPRAMKIKRRGRDVAILLDTSRSMLAEDIKPNRLEHSKLAIKDLMERLQGDRIAVVTFAGNASVKCPLTQDYAFVRMVLDNISTESTTRGGTMIGDAVRKAVADVFDDQSRKYKDIILITDGEDHDSFPIRAAEKSAENGVRIIAIGLGSDTEGSRIPVTGPKGEKTFLKYDGKEVWSKLDSDLLRKIVYATEGGKYLSVEPGETFNLGDVYQSLIATAEKRELESATMTRYDERFQIFLSLGLALIVLEALLTERKKLEWKS